MDSSRREVEMMRLIEGEILMILDLFREKYGPGYAKDGAVSRLQAKLSMMLSASRLREVAE